MIKIIDLDKLFDNYISEYVYGNIGKLKPEEIEDKIPVLYEQFGSEPLKDLGGKTPNEYYASFPVNELLECLKEHIEKKVPVSDFLAEAIFAADGAEDALINALSDSGNAEFTLYVLNILGMIKSEKCAEKLLFLCMWDEDEGVRELSAELLFPLADKVKDRIISEFPDAPESVKPSLLDVISRAKHDEGIFEILSEEFIKHGENLPMYAGFLAKYGDERALPLLERAIEDEKIKYSDFEELRFAIEALGGEYEKPRDFSHDKTYKKIMGGRK